MMSGVTTGRKPGPRMLVAALLVAGNIAAAAGDTVKGKTMDTIESRMAERLHAFDNTQDATLFQQSLDELAAMPGPPPAGGFDAVVLAQWLQFFAALDAVIEPRWEPGAAPPAGVPLPAQHGVVYPSRDVDPATIADSAERARYEAAQRANRDAIARHDAQLQLRRIEADAMARLQLAFGPVAAATPAERQRLMQQIGASSLGADRKQRLQATLGGSGAMR